jgi:hypothetical protein
MTRYVRRVPEVEAVVFSPELSMLTEDGGKLALNARARLLGITYAEGKGYQYRGNQLLFGDFIVTTGGVKPVWRADDFCAQFRTKDDES